MRRGRYLSILISPRLTRFRLNDYHIARHRAQNFGKGILGHELADGSYVLDQRPDLIFLCDLWASVCFESDNQILNNSRFADSYQLVHFQTDPPYATNAAMYIRRVDGKLGIHQTGNTLVIPAYLSVDQKDNSVRLVDGRAQLVLPPGGSAEFRNIPVPPGLWTFHVHTKSPSEAVVTDLNSHAESAIGAAFATNKPTFLPERMGFEVENRSKGPLVIESIYLDRN